MSAVLFLLIPLFAFAELNSQDIYQCVLKQVIAIEQEGVLRTRITGADARSRFMPELSASIRPIAAKQGEFSSNSNTATLSVQQRILDFESLSVIDAADAGTKAARLELLQQGLERAFLALEDLGQIQTVENQLELLDLQVRSYLLSKEIMATGSRLGVSDSNDLLQLKSQILFLQTEMNRLQFETNRRKSVFAAQYGFNPVNLLNVRLPASIAEVDIDRLPGALAISAQVEQARFEKLVYQRRLWPELSLQASYTSAQSAWPSQTAYPDRFASVALVADLSGFWREYKQRELQAPIINTRISRLNYNLRNLKVEFEQLNLELDLLVRQRPLIIERLNVTQKSKEVSKAKIRLGRISFLELQQSEQAAFSASQESFLLNLRVHLLKLRKDLAANFDVTKHSRVVCHLEKTPQ